MSICAAFMFFTTLLALGLRTLLIWRNRKLDREFGHRLASEDKRAVAVENYGPNFRYVL